MFKIKQWFWSLILIMPAVAHAADHTIDFNAILTALKNNAGPLMRLVVATAYVIGIFLVISAIKELKRLGQASNYATPNFVMSSSIVKFIVGILLIYLPSTINIGLLAFWGKNGGKLLEYTAAAGDNFGAIKEGAIAVLRLVGCISLVKGLITLSHSAGQNAQQGTFSKGLLHVIGGILSINVVATIKVIGNTLGIEIL